MKKIEQKNEKVLFEKYKTLKYKILWKRHDCEILYDYVISLFFLFFLLVVLFV